METFEIERNGQTFEVQAPDIQSAAKVAETHQLEQHPWKQFNKASRGGPPHNVGGIEFGQQQSQPPELGKEFPGGGYLPTKTEAAGDVAMLGGMALAGPMAGAMVPSAPVLAPAAARTAVSAIPGLLQGDPEKSLRGMGTTAGIEVLGSLLGIPGFASQMRRGPIHQTVNFPARTAAGQAPAVVRNASGSGVTTVQPPVSGQIPSQMGNVSHPDLIVPIGSAASPTVGQGVRTGTEMLANQDQDLSSNLLAWLGLSGKLPLGSANRFMR